ncbi:hypothetical protein AMATHDRAFT_72074 [Amanita thiersii Skay4041]|uniref:Uncharacterized protein n=1 Tax=Amanita thiersii Skay4041 TaxID=703135 RepID=A0A2A9N9V8_9AGAR|nr:hypothetical protein AMATHDRAFT_72074 [Amanita thiersii Skay4041]
MQSECNQIILIRIIVARIVEQDKCAIQEWEESQQSEALGPGVIVLPSIRLGCPL